VDSKLDNAKRVFGSKDEPSSINACDQLLAENGELLEEVKQTCKELEKEGQSLCNQLLPWLKTDALKSVSVEDVAAYCTPPLKRDGKIRNSIDHLDVAGGKELTSYDHISQALMRNRLHEAHCKELFSNQQKYVRQIATKIQYETDVQEVSLCTHIIFFCLPVNYGTSAIEEVPINLVTLLQFVCTTKLPVNDQ